MSGNYRIVEKIYADGHKEYIAQKAKSFLFFKIWKNYVLKEEAFCWDGSTVKFFCDAETYEECLKKLNDDLALKKALKDHSTVKEINYYATE